MKTRITIAVLSMLLMFNVVLNAQPKKVQKMDNLIENCYNSLTNDNAGVQEAGIYISIQFKNKFPDLNDKKFVKALDNLASDSKSARISYKAQLAKIYYQNPEWFKDVKIKSILEQQEVYEEISNKLNTIMFASKDL